MASTTTIQVDLIKNWPIAWPRLENERFIMTIGSARPMEDAARIAYRELVRWLAGEYGLDEFEAYFLLTQAGKLRRRQHGRSRNTRSARRSSNPTSPELVNGASPWISDSRVSTSSSPAASKGIGRHAADVFAEEGANVSICARKAAEVNDAVASLKAKKVKAIGTALDVSDKAALEAWVADSAKQLGGIDIVIANVSALAVEDNEEAWRKQFEIDMMHTVRTVNAAIPYLEKSRAPSIVIISSVSGREIDFTGPAYGAIKAALIHYAQRLAYQYAPR